MEVFSYGDIHKTFFLFDGGVSGGGEGVVGAAAGYRGDGCTDRRGPDGTGCRGVGDAYMRYLTVYVQ